MPSVRPRIRTLKPEIWQSPSVGALSRDARLLWIGLITQADDQGRLRGEAMRLKAQIYPFDFMRADEIESWRGELSAQELIEIYAVDGNLFIQICGWSEHQRVDKAKPSDLPAPAEGCPICEVNAGAPASDPQLEAILDKVRSETPPPLRSFPCMPSRDLATLREPSGIVASGSGSPSALPPGSGSGTTTTGEGIQKPIPGDSAPELHAGGNSAAELADVALERFERLLGIYPRPLGSQEAIDGAIGAWVEALASDDAPEDPADIEASVELLAASWAWREQGGRYVPSMDRFLDEHRWLEVPGYLLDLKRGLTTAEAARAALRDELVRAFGIGPESKLYVDAGAVSAPLDLLQIRQKAILRFRRSRRVEKPQIAEASL